MRERTILVVDDEKNTRLSLGEALTPLGFNVVTAASGEEALAKLEADRPVLMLLDLLMPGVDGMEVLERTAHTHPEVRVIIVTVHGSIENAIEAMKLGAADVIEKPFSVDEIRALVGSVLDRERVDAARAEPARHVLEAGTVADFLRAPVEADGDPPVPPLANPDLDPGTDASLAPKARRRLLRSPARVGDVSGPPRSS